MTVAVQKEPSPLERHREEVFGARLVGVYR